MGFRRYMVYRTYKWDWTQSVHADIETLSGNQAVIKRYYQAVWAEYLSHIQRADDYLSGRVPDCKYVDVNGVVTLSETVPSVSCEKFVINGWCIDRILRAFENGRSVGVQYNDSNKTVKHVFTLEWSCPKCGKALTCNDGGIRRHLASVQCNTLTKISKAKDAGLVPTDFHGMQALVDAGVEVRLVPVRQVAWVQPWVNDLVKAYNKKWAAGDKMVMDMTLTEFIRRSIGE